MTYEAIETSDYDAEAVELYFFDGTFNDYALTSYARDYTYNSQVYTSLPGLSRKALKVTSQGGSSTGQLEVEIPFDHPLALEYAYASSPPNLSLTLRRGHASDVDQAFRTIWTGPVVSFTVKDRLASLRIPSVFSQVLQNTVPRRRWQEPCNHMVYDEFCGVNPVLFSQSTFIDTIVGNSIVVQSLSWSGTEGVNGEIINNTRGERRTIKSHTGTNVITKTPFFNAQPGDSVTLRNGCDLSYDVCNNTFNNTDNRLGFSLIPGVNPFTTGRIR